MERDVLLKEVTESGNEWARELKEAQATLLKQQRELLEDRKRTVTKQLKGFVAENARQQDKVAYKTAEAKMLMFLGFSQTYAVEDAGSISSMRVWLCCAEGLAI